ncbi:MAG: cobalamin ABC transporter substrate-binding protein [Minicystis sp.]
MPLTTALVASLALCSAGIMGCEPSQPSHTAAAAGLPRWEARARQLFDDNIDPAAVGLSMDGPSPRADAGLRERAQTSDVVARVRVQTVTVDSVGEQKTYHLGIQVGVPTLADAKVSDRTFELLIKPTSGAFGIAKAFDARLRGQTFVGFVKRFATEDGEVEVHWHLSPDTAEVVSAVKEAVALREMSGS